MGLLPETFNVIQLGISFFFIFFAFNSQGFIEESVVDSAHDRGDINKHAGYYRSILGLSFSELSALQLINHLRGLHGRKFCGGPDQRITGTEMGHDPWGALLRRLPNRIP